MHFLLFHNDAHYYKITGILKQLKFRRSLQHVSVHAGTIIREPFLCLTKTTVMVLYPRRLWRGHCHGSIPTCCAGLQYRVEKGTWRLFSVFRILLVLLYYVTSNSFLPISLYGMMTSLLFTITCTYFFVLKKHLSVTFESPNSE
jgi:hypothetical protein